MSTKDKLITSVFITLSLILACYLQSCTSYQYTYNQKFHKQYNDKCPTFKNKYTNGLEF